MSHNLSGNDVSSVMISRQKLQKQEKSIKFSRKNSKSWVSNVFSAILIRAIEILKCDSNTSACLETQTGSFQHGKDQISSHCYKMWKCGCDLTSGLHSSIFRFGAFWLDLVCGCLWHIQPTHIHSCISNTSTLLAHALKGAWRQTANWKAELKTYMRLMRLWTNYETFESFESLHESWRKVATLITSHGITRISLLDFFAWKVCQAASFCQFLAKLQFPFWSTTGPPLLPELMASNRQVHDFLISHICDTHVVLSSNSESQVLAASIWTSRSLTLHPFAWLS